ncbi:MAG: hypothetical protein ACTS4V_00080 [Candidatus Hodgkinia cicadicola]
MLQILKITYFARYISLPKCERYWNSTRSRKSVKERIARPLGRDKVTFKMLNNTIEFISRKCVNIKSSSR